MASRWAWLRRGASRPWVLLLTSSTAEALGVVVPTPTLFWAWAAVAAVPLSSRASSTRRAGVDREGKESFM